MSQRTTESESLKERDWGSSLPIADLWEVALWEDILSVDGTNLQFCQQVDNQAIVIPETIDAIRALSGIEPDAQASISKTDASLGLVNEFNRPFEPKRL